MVWEVACWVQHHFLQHELVEGLGSVKLMKGFLGIKAKMTLELQESPCIALFFLSPLKDIPKDKFTDYLYFFYISSDKKQMLATSETTLLVYCE